MKEYQLTISDWNVIEWGWRSFVEEFGAEAGKPYGKAGINQTIGALQMTMKVEVAVMEVFQPRQNVPNERALI